MGANKEKDGKAGGVIDCGKYARYTPEQVEVLERFYIECPKPSSSRRQQIIRECPSLANIGQKQLKVWFQNRRCREKQRKETNRLQNWNSKLNAMNQILLEENERLQKQAAQLSSENQYLRQQLQLQQPNVDPCHRVAHPVIMATTDTSSESVVTSGHHQHSPQHPSQECLSQLSVIAERTLAEFLAKATESVVDGIPLPGMKPGPDSIGAIALSRACGGVAAQACGFVDLDPMKVSEIVKNRPLWLQDCRKLDILATFEADRGGLVELVHTQMYAPTSLVHPRDFWTLRYTCYVEDGSLVVCERSLAAGQSLQEISTITPGFLRAEMLSSGCLIRALGQGGSMVMVVDDINFKCGGSLSGGFQPLFASSFVLARRMTSKVLLHLRNVSKEKADTDIVNNASALRGFNHRLVRGFNDAVNCFQDEGWVSIISDGPSSVSVQIKPCKQLGASDLGRGGVVCAKADLLLPNVPPLLLVNFLKERWTMWADCDTDVCLQENTLKRKISSVQVLQPAVGQDEMLEVVRLQKPNLSASGDDPSQQDYFLLQLMSGVEDIVVNAFAQLIFAPIDASVPDDAPLLPSGFRIVHLDSNSEKATPAQTLDLASTLEDRAGIHKLQAHNATCSSEETSSVLTIAFQYMYEGESRDMVALRAQRHVRGLVDLIQQMAISLQPPQPLSTDSHSGFEALVLVQWMVDSYSFHSGQELLPGIERGGEMLFKSFWTHRHAIICCAWKPLPEFIFANSAALEMLETSLGALRDMSLERMFNDGRRKTDYLRPPPFIQKEGYTRLPAGVCLTSTGRPVSFENAAGWKVITGDQSVPVAAFMFCNWSFGSVQVV